MNYKDIIIWRDEYIKEIIITIGVIITFALYYILPTKTKEMIEIILIAIAGIMGLICLIITIMLLLGWLE